jgi:ferrochelatase
MTERSGVLLLNLGTPDALTPRAVRRYLREFLSDHRVIDIPLLARKLLVECIILPFRTRKSLRNYRSIWLPEGAPLRVYTERIQRQLAAELGGESLVKVAMRYGNPSISLAMAEFERAGIQRITCIPLFPQYSGAAWGSAVAEFMRIAAHRENVVAIDVVPPYFAHPLFVQAWTDLVRDALGQQPDAHVLFSYHSLPVRQIRKADVDGSCQLNAACCQRPPPSYCYRAQCEATSRAIAASLALPADRWTTAFQSRFGNAEWLSPATEESIRQLAAQKSRKLIVVSPSFVVDCLETLEELGIRGREVFLEAGGQSYQLVPCLQDSKTFVTCLHSLLRH